MNYKKIANSNHEEHHTTRTYSRHGLSKGRRKTQRIRDRAAKREEGRRIINEQINLDVQRQEFVIFYETERHIHMRPTLAPPTGTFTLAAKLLQATTLQEIELVLCKAPTI